MLQTPSDVREIKIVDLMNNPEMPRMCPLATFAPADTIKVVVVHAVQDFVGDFVVRETRICWNDGEFERIV